MVLIFKTTKNKPLQQYNNHNEKKQEVSKIFKVPITVTKLTEFYHLNFARIILTDSWLTSSFFFFWRVFFSRYLMNKTKRFVYSFLWNYFKFVVIFVERFKVMPGKLTIAFTISGLVQSRKMFWLNDIGSLGEPRNKKINRLSPLFHHIEKDSNGTFNPLTATGRVTKT